MEQSNTSPAAISIGSLIAITAGTVSAALLIMFVGLFFTMISLGTATQTASISSSDLKNDAFRVMVVSNDRLGQGTQKHKSQKGRFMDALFREDSGHLTIPSEHKERAYVPRIYAISAPVMFPTQEPHLVQI